MSKNFEIAKEIYANIGVDVEHALKVLSDISISLHCWQGDDVGGYEKAGSSLTGGGIQTTGNYPGKARNIDELKQDLEKAYSMLPGNNRLSLHAIYLDNKGKFFDRNEIEPSNFETWVDFAKKNNLALDFNPTFFSHEYAKDDLTLANSNKTIRDFWIEHGKRCRKIGEYFGKSLGKRCITNFWMPDGYKDNPIDRYAPRMRLKESLDEIFALDIDINANKDALESKLFGIGTESYVVGSHEFYMGYTMKNRNVMPCLDAGHFHPTEVISNKISSFALFYDEMLLHVSRPVRWDSDHVVILDDELRAITQEITRNNLFSKVNIALDYFDASINRVAAWVIGVRSTQKALLSALLEPSAQLKKLEIEGDLTSRLALTEEYKTLPFGFIWDHFCEINNVPVGSKWLDEIKNYEVNILSKR